MFESSEVSRADEMAPPAWLGPVSKYFSLHLPQRCLVGAGVKGLVGVVDAVVIPTLNAACLPRLCRPVDQVERSPFEWESQQIAI